MLKAITQHIAQAKNLVTFTGLRTMGQVLEVAVPLIVAKLFSPELFASFSLARSIIFFIAAITLSSVQTPFMVYANQEREKTGKISRSFTIQCIFLLVSLGLFSAIALIFAKPIILFAKISQAELFYVSLGFAGFAVKTFISNLFMALGQRIKHAMAILIYSALTVFFVIVFCLVDWINLRSVFLIYFLATVLLVLFFIKAVDFNLLLPFDFSSKHFKEMLNFTKWVFLGVTAAYFVHWGDSIVLRLFVPMDDIGYYNLAYQFFKGLIFLTGALNIYFLPFISQHIENAEKLRNYLYSKRPKIIALGLVGLVCIFFLFPYVLRMFYGNIYSKSILVLQILLIANAINLYVIFYAPIFNAVKKYKFFNIAAVIQITINLLLDLTLVPYMGMLGAAIATVIAYFCHAVVLEVYFRYRIRPLVTL